MQAANMNRIYGVWGRLGFILRFCAILLIVVLGSPSTLLSGVHAKESCHQTVAHARNHRNDIRALEEAVARANAICDARNLRGLSDLLAFALFNTARELTGAERRELLSRATGLTKDWRVHATLGGDQLKTGEYVDAAGSLQLALTDLQERDGAGASDAVIERIVTMTNNARALAGEYIPNPTTRSGDPSGSAATSIGGVSIETVPFPIEFEFAKDVPTDDGLFAIEDLISILDGSDVGTVTLAGHTDPVGGDKANQRLSEDRALAVRNSLVAALLPGASQIRVVGCGETSPPKIESPEYFTEAEIHQIMRRVELVREGAPCR